MRRAWLPQPRILRPPEAFLMSARRAARKVFSAGSGKSPTASRASVEATTSRVSSPRAKGAQCSKRPPPGPAS
eukprot:518942-Lingulodinium_polyedra.AAC.1